MNTIEISPALLERFDRPVPRYTSYPTAPQFQVVEEDLLVQKLAVFDQTEKPLSLYLHIPFCRSMCLFCACSVVLNRNPERQARYLDSLLQEIALAASHFSKKRAVMQLHLGGGTPTSLTEAEFERLMEHLHAHFEFPPAAELSIEVDPRTVQEDGGRKLALLRRLGFNRVSFGVQDLDEAVQEAVKRRQSEEMTMATYWKSRDLGFEGINIDLIYGLPFQTSATFARTAEKLMAIQPDRIAFYSYAKVPWLKPHQKAIPDAALPSTEEKFRIYVEARERFLNSGYVQIGMDHFSLENDLIAKSFKEKTLTRNFQGYSIQLAEDMLGFGVTAIGFFEHCFFQNLKETDGYGASCALGKFPVQRGFLLSEEDLRRRWTILSLMCHFEVDKLEFEKRFGIVFDLHFASLKEKLDCLKKEGLLEETADRLIPTPLGCLFIRLVASAFDAYLNIGKFSRAV